MAEVALAVVLVVGAGLLMRSFQKLMTVDAGFNRERLMTFGVVLPRAALSARPDGRVAFFDRLTDAPAGAARRHRRRVDDGSAARSRTSTRTTPTSRATPRRPSEPAENVDYYQTVSVDYLKTMGIPVVKGRGFEPADIAGGAGPAGERDAREDLLHAAASSRRSASASTSSSGPAPPPFTIVGVVRDVKQGGMAKKTGTELYFLNEQGPRIAGFAPGSMNVVVRSALPEQALAQEIQQAVRAQDPTLPIVKLRSMEQVFSDSAARPRFLAELLAIFAGLALALAAIGTYGILSYSVTERTKEIGIHMALGATRGSVLGMILGQGMRLDDRRPGRRPDRVVRPDPAAAGPAVQREADRSGHADGRGRLHRRHRVRRLLCAGAARHPGRPDDHAARVVAPRRPRLR